MHRTDKHIAWITLSLIFVLGCDTFNTMKVDNPVVGPAPPRVSMTNEMPTGTEYVQNSTEFDENDPYSSGVQPVSLSRNIDKSSSGLDLNQIVATVNGSPIFASEILDRYSKPLENARLKMPPEQFQKARLQLIKRDLDGHVKRKLLVLALKSTLSKEQLEMIDEQLDKAFEKETDRLQKDLKVNSLIELAAKLKKEGTSLSNLKEAFSNTQLATEYLRAKSKTDQQIGRQELVDYYHEHLNEYSITGKVRWQQITVTIAKHGSEKQAQTYLGKAIEELNSGASFASVAKKYSDGPEAYRGGEWDWIQQGSLANEQLDKVIFELPVGRTSQVIINKNSYTLAKVLERVESGSKPFEELQDEIRKKIELQSHIQAKDDLIKELQEAATIETIFDKS